MTTPLRFLFGLAVLAPLPARAADDVRVNVVVDVTPEGKNVAPPTPDRPVFYFPIYIGYKEIGGVVTEWRRPPPPLEEVKRAMTEALLAQGYRIATQLHPPSLAIVFRWGTIATDVVEEPGSFAGGNGRTGGGPGISGSLSAVNQNVVLTYIAGDRWRDYQIEDPRQWEAIKEGLINPRYFLLISALDFPAFTRHKQVLLWRAHVSTNYWGHYLDEALQPLITAAAPMLGKETSRPEIVSAAVAPIGRVVVGTPEVKDYSGTH